MANRERQVRIYDLHSWTGVALGLLLFLVAFTGCVALFFGEFQPWEDPAQRIQRHGDAIPLHGMLADVASDVGAKGELAYLSVTPGGHGHAHAEVYASWRDADGEIHQEHMHINPNTGEVMPERGSGASRFLYDLHRDLAWPDALGGRQVGRFIVGVVGIAFMLTIVTGIVAHTKITKELFTLRYLRSVRLKWQDTHKVFGLWTVPFSAMIALTGAWLGVIALVTPLFAAIVAKGDVEALYKEFGLAAGEPSGIAADMLSVDQFTPSVHPKTGKPLVFISVDNWGDETAVYHLYYGVSDQLKYYDELKVSAVSGEPIVDRSSQLAERPAFRISA
ncbi:MAG: PepSY-associated TM helix domain-containing protein, partial [Pseudomonadota bacterium]